MCIERLNNQLDFIVEIDKLKKVIRRNLLCDQSRRENTAEHSWHAALMALVLSEHRRDPAINVDRVIKMILVHDLVEIDAGDTYCYDIAAHVDKAKRESEAAKRIFGLLPDDQRRDIGALWDEFEEEKTPESHYANAIDRLNPFLLNFHSGGKSWKDHGVNRKQVLERMSKTMEYIPAIQPMLLSMIETAVERGWIKP